MVVTTKAMEHNSPDLVVIEEVLKLWSNGLLSTFNYLLWSCQLLQVHWEWFTTRMVVGWLGGGFRMMLVVKVIKVVVVAVTEVWWC